MECHLQNVALAFPSKCLSEVVSHAIGSLDKSHIGNDFALLNTFIGLEESQSLNSSDAFMTKLYETAPELLNT